MLGLVLGLIFVKWVRFQSLLWLACFFQALVIVWRVLYSGVGGYASASWFEFITYRTSDPGDVPSFCIPLALMLYDLRHKLQSRDDLYQRVCNKRSCYLVCADLLLFAVYSCIWGYLYIRAKDTTFSLATVNYGTGIMIALFAVPFTALGIALHN